MSQRERILNYLKEGHTITPLEALKFFGSLNLRNRICELRDRGIAIDSKLIKVSRHKWVKKYWLKGE